MDREGHLGFTFLIYFGSLYLINLFSYNYLILGLLMGFFSSLPDIDIRLRIKHRGITHSIFTGLLISLGFGYLFQYFGLGFNIGFLSVFIAYLLHLIGDLFTYHPFKPLYPLSKKSLSFKLFRSNNKFVNKSMLSMGTFAFTVYVLKLSGVDILQLIF